MSAPLVCSDTLSAVAETALEEARRLGASTAEATTGAVSSLEVCVHMGETETIESGNERSFGVTVYFGTRKGSAAASDFSIPAITEAVGAACNIARYTSEDDYAGLADAELMAVSFPDLDLDRGWEIDVRQAIDIALECEDAMRGVDKIDNTEGVSVSTTRSEHCYANTHGFVHTDSGTRHGISGAAIARGEGGMQRDFWYSVHRHPEQLEAPGDIGRRAAERAVERLGARKVKTCRVPVLFEAAIARGLLSEFAGAISGDALYRQVSFLPDSLGKRLFPHAVNIVERPHLPGALGSTAFDGEGVATYEHDIVRDGVLESYILDSYSARRLGMKTTANAGGLHNWVFTGETHSFQSLVEEMRTGFFVTELMGHGANPVTGDYSQGASGFWVEDGVVAYPVTEMTIAANLRDMFQGIVGVGDDVDARGSIRCGSILVGEMMIAGD